MPNQEKDTDCDTKSSSCKNLPGSYTCICKGFFTDVSPDPTRPGRKCLDQCHVNPCQNGGTCKQRLGLEPRCVCPSGVTHHLFRNVNHANNINSFLSSSDDDNSSDDSDVEKKAKMKKKRPKFITESNTQPKNTRDIEYNQPSKSQNPNNPEPVPPKRPPKPPSYNSCDPPFQENGTLPPVPPRKNSLTGINGDSAPPPPLPKHKFHQAPMKHEDLHSRPPPPPPRDSSFDDHIDNGAPPALPPKSSRFS